MAPVTSVQSGRIRVLKEGSRSSDQTLGPLVYWMFRDQRLRDNWALIHAVDQANKAKVPVAVAFNLFDQFLGAKARQLGFMLKGLRQLHRSIEETPKMPFFLFQGVAEETTPNFLRECGASVLVKNFSPLREIQRCKEDICKKKGAEVPEIEWCEPGEDAAMEALMGSKDGFLTKRLKNYSTDWNNPLKPKALSGLSPYLHFGQVSGQRCAIEARRVRQLGPQAVDTFLEELIVRRKLADNFCFYQPRYDSLKEAWEWAHKSLMDHGSDKREHIYTMKQLEKAQMADPLWSALHLEMVHYGKMHGFTRMYWAKKILEWIRGPEEALSYEIDGRDPNGYVGCMWSICGVHDQGWRGRPVFGKVRYTNYAGCKRKFDVDGYIAYVKRLVGGIKKRKADNLLSGETNSAVS